MSGQDGQHERRQRTRRSQQARRHRRQVDERRSWTRRRSDGSWFTHRPGRRERTALVANQVVAAVLLSGPWFLVTNPGALGSGLEERDTGSSLAAGALLYLAMWAYIVYRAATVSLTVTDDEVVVRNVFLTRRYPLAAITVGEVYLPGDLKLHSWGPWGGASWWSGISATTARSPEEPRPLKITALGSRSQGAPVVGRFEAALGAARWAKSGRRGS